MQLRNSQTDYGLISRLLHWIIAFGILAQWLLAETAEEAEHTAPVENLTGIGLHQSLGVLVLLLATMRVLWRLIDTQPLWPAALKPYELMLARIVHAAFYVLLFAIPLSGWALSSAEGEPVTFFGLFQLPPLSLGSEDVLEEVHEVLFNVLAALALLHVLAAAKHRFLDRTWRPRSR